MVDQVRLDLNVARQQKRELRLLVEHADHRRLVDSDDNRFTYRLGRRLVRFLTREAAFAEEFTGTKNPDDALFALMRRW